MFYWIGISKDLDESLAFEVEKYIPNHPINLHINGVVGKINQRFTEFAVLCNQLQ